MIDALVLVAVENESVVRLPAISVYSRLFLDDLPDNGHKLLF